MTLICHYIHAVGHSWFVGPPVSTGALSAGVSNLFAVFKTPTVSLADSSSNRTPLTFVINFQTRVENVALESYIALVTGPAITLESDDI